MIPLHEETDVRRKVSLFEQPASTGQVVSTLADEAWITNPLSAFTTAYELQLAKRSNQRILKTEAAERLTAAGIPEAIADIPYSYVSEEWVSMQEQLAKERRERELVLSRAEGGFSETVLSLGAALGVSIIDPINVAASFIPYYGQARYASALARASGAMGRAGVRARFGATEGLTGAALLELGIHPAMQAQYADYDMMDSLLNVSIGTVMGAGLHAGAGAIKDRFTKLVKDGKPNPAGRAVNTPEPVGINGERMAALTTQEREMITRSVIAQGGEGYVEIDDLVQILEKHRIAKEGIPIRQRELYIRENIEKLETWIKAQDEITPKTAAEELADIQRSLDNTPGRIKERTRELQQQKVKFKAAKKQATEDIEAENIRLRNALEQSQVNVDAQAKRMDRARRELAQLKQRNIPERLRKGLEWQEMRSPEIGRIENIQDRGILADEIREHIRALKAHAEKPDKDILRAPDQQNSTAASLQETQERIKDTPEEKQQEINDLKESGIEIDEETFDREMAELEEARSAGRVVAACVAEAA